MIKKSYTVPWLAVITSITVATTPVAQAQTILSDIETIEVIPPSSPLPEDNPDSQSIPIPVEPPVSPPEKPSSPRVCNEGLAANIEKIIKRVGGNWGILVETLSDGTVIYEYNPGRSLIPASNMKILTTAAALQLLSPQTNISGNKSLREWVTVTNLRSNNFYADTLLKRIGGAAVAKRILAELGVNLNGFHFADGSGLSRRNLATPRAIVDTLKAMYYSPQRDVFLASLPTAGISGTLRNRMKQTPVEGIVHAKTGTLTGVRALSGYLEHQDYGMLVFSIIANSSGQSGTALVRAIDEIVVNVYTHTRCAPQSTPSGL